MGPSAGSVEIDEKGGLEQRRAERLLLRSGFKTPHWGGRGEGPDR